MLRLVLVLVGYLVCSLPPSTFAKSPAETPVHRDPEIEEVLNQYARPLFASAGIVGKNVQVHAIEHDSIGILFADPQTLFITTGALIQTDTANELVCRLAHEIGHLLNGHWETLRLRLKSNPKHMVRLATDILTNRIKLSPADLAKGKPIKELRKVPGFTPREATKAALTSLRRSEEMDADETAVFLLTGAKESSVGLFTFVQTRHAQGLMFATDDFHSQVHPAWPERIDRLKAMAQPNTTASLTGATHIVQRHELMVAKASNLGSKPRIVLNRYPESNQSPAGRYARAIAYLRMGETSKGLPLLARLSQEQPDNRHFAEAQTRFQKK